MSRLLREDVTLLVPTHDRYAFLERLLRYYRRCDAPFPMRLLDSSAGTSTPEPVATLARQCGADVERYDPNTNPSDKLTDALRSVDTPFSVIWADDDLIVPAGINDSVEFLATHETYSVADGLCGVVDSKAGPKPAPMRALHRYPQGAVENDAASERLLTYFTKSVAVFYAVHRTAWLRRNLELCRANELRHRWGELALAGLDFIQGKSRTLDRLYMVWQSHGENDMWRPRGDSGERLDWVVADDFPAKYRRFQDILVQELVAQDGLPRSKAANVVRKGFHRYLANYFSLEFRGDSFRQAAGMVWRRIRRRVNQDGLALPALMSPESPHHQDFAPIYAALTGEEAVAIDRPADGAADGVTGMARLPAR